METKTTLKGQALRTYNRVLTAIDDDSDSGMLHAFANLTQQAKNIALQSGKFANLFVRGDFKEMPLEEAGKELAERSIACVSCKLRNIDIIIATVFLTEYINRQRKQIEK